MTEPKVTINKPEAEGAASEPVAATNKKIVEVTDDLGRKLEIKKMSALDKVDMAAVLGADRAHNGGVNFPCMLAWMVKKIDGEVQFPITTWDQMRAKLQTLDDEGLEAAAKAADEHFKMFEGIEALNVKNS